MDLVVADSSRRNADISRATSAERDSALSVLSCPRSMRLARSTSASRVNRDIRYALPHGGTCEQRRPRLPACQALWGSQSDLALLPDEAPSRLHAPSAESQLQLFQGYSFNLPRQSDRLEQADVPVRRVDSPQLPWRAEVFMLSQHLAGEFRQSPIWPQKFPC